MPFEISVDLGNELREAQRRYAGEPEWEAFLDHVRAEHLWSERWPRRLLAWATRHKIKVFDTKRFIVVMTAGFDCPERWRLWRAVKTELRRAREAIASGEESGLIYADGRDLLTFEDEPPHRWGATETIMRPSHHGSFGGPPPLPSAPPAPTLAPGPVTPGAPAVRPPGGGWMTRR
jgi:hypothetical protein